MEKHITGYPSIDKPWLKYYRDSAEEEANNIPENKTVWDVMEEKMQEYKDIPAINYFGRSISRKEFTDSVYKWARAFKAMGIKENDVIPFYGPFSPDIGAIIFAMNMIGACPYFLKLAISPSALAEETKESTVAIVFDEMWQNVHYEFSKDRFKRVLIYAAADAMPFPKKQIVSLISKKKADKSSPQIPHSDKYIHLNQAIKYADQYAGEVRVPFVPNRAAFITSSSGTTVDGIVKGTVATNESTISQLYMGNASDIQYFPGDKCLNHFPPTASTSLNVLFFLALFKGMTIYMDPRVSEKDFYNQITTIKPNMALTTGSAWEAFFNRVKSEMKQGKSFDLSCAKGWTVGGEGTDVRKFQKWNDIMDKAGGVHLFSGYGSSELFSATCVEKVNARYDCSKQIMSVGIPYAGINMGVFDSKGNELGYNQRGELRIKSKSAMKEYYNKPDLTAKTKIDGWICTGDLAEIDENGFIYIWGRCKDTVTVSDGSEIYLFDIANKIKEKEYINDAIVLPVPEQNPIMKLVAHIVWEDNVADNEKAKYVEDLNATLHSYLPEPLFMYAYAEHQGMLPYSPTTLKKDKNKLFKQTSGFYQVHEGKLEEVKMNT